MNQTYFIIRKRDELIKAEKENGATYKELAKKYGLSYSRVQQICAHIDHLRMVERNPIYSDFKRYGVNGTRIYHVLHRAGVDTKEQIIELMKSGKIMKIPNFGETYFRMICEVYKESLPQLKCDDDFEKTGELMSKEFHYGDKIQCKSWKELRRKALILSSIGYGVSVVGFSDMSDNILTITAEKL